MSGAGEPGQGHLGGVLGVVVRIATVVILAANLMALVIGVVPNLSTRIVDLGESFWPGYGNELRRDPKEPECVVAELEQRLTSCAPSAAPAPTATDPFAGKDPFAAPGAAPAPAPSDPFAGKDPFAAPAPTPAPAPTDPFAGKDPFAAPAPAPVPALPADPFATPAPADPFAAPAPVDPFAPAVASGPSCEAVRALHDQCVQTHAAYSATIARITPQVKQFRTVELLISDLARFGWWKHTLVLVVLMGAASATASRMHVALRAAATPTEHRVAQISQLIAHLMWMGSCLADWRVQQASSAEVEDPALPVMWAVGFAAIAAINVYHLVKPPAGLTGGTNLGRLLMTIPLYAYLTVLSGLYFYGVEQHWSGQAIYLHKFTGHPEIYIGIALYVWAGMLLSETRVAPLTFDVLAPWKLSPHLLGWLVAVISAVPTAYSGASGIFVISTGRVVFHRLRAGGASARVARGATAKAGSLGVVLRPCLIVVLISVLNNIPTEQLFASGFQVFLLTAVLYFFAMFFLREKSNETVDVGEAASSSLRSIGALVPFGLIAVATVLFYRFAFEIHVNEQTAQLVLPVVLLGMVVYDRIVSNGLAGAKLSEPLARATHESSHHAGALLTVMAGSVGFGGIVERANVMDLVPQDLGSPYTAMAILVVVMILVGMAMDALGAVILVSVTVAPLAYANGIDPIHFWMMALVGFELGYLHPPVGLNLLLARQVIGPDAHVERFPVQGFFKTWEHMIVPVTVMGVALAIVAFAPFLAYPLSH